MAALQRRVSPLHHEPCGRQVISLPGRLNVKLYADSTILNAIRTDLYSDSANGLSFNFKIDVMITLLLLLS
eukprot:1037901-Prymnesium_polylepis.1